MEGTVRVFAGEYAGCTLTVPDDENQSPAWVVTPGGAYCRFMFLSGTLTEVTDIGDMVHSRIADPTGVFNLVIGGRNTALAETFRKLSVPSFVTVIGRAQMYLKEGCVSLSVRPDSIQNVNRQVRDRWVLATAQATLGRLFLMNHAIQGRCTDRRILVAFNHYSITKTRLRELAVMVESVVQAVRPLGCDSSVSPDVRTLVIEFMQAGSGPRGISVDDIIEQAAMRGVFQEAVLAAIESLIIDDECYQPKKGFVKLL